MPVVLNIGGSGAMEISNELMEITRNGGSRRKSAESGSQRPGKET